MVNQPTIIQAGHKTDCDFQTWLIVGQRNSRTMGIRDPVQTVDQLFEKLTVPLAGAMNR